MDCGNALVQRRSITETNRGAWNRQARQAGSLPLWRCYLKLGHRLYLIFLRIAGIPSKGSRAESIPKIIPQGTPVVVQ